MSDNKKIDSSKGRVHSVLEAVKKIVAEDPFIGGLFLVIVAPLGWIMIQAVLSLNVQQALLIITVLGISVLLIFIPLLILKTKRTEKNDIKEIRMKILEDERIRRRIADDLTQQRANKVINAKVENLKAQTNYLLDQTERFEKYLLKESGKMIADSVGARFGQMEFVDKEACTKTVSVVLDSFKNIDDKYDNLINSFSVFQASLELIAKEQAPDPPKVPDIKIENEVKDPNETPFVSPELSDSAKPQVELKTEYSTGTELNETELKDALEVIDGLDISDDGPPSPKEEIILDEVAVPKEKSLPPNTWECPKCGQILQARRVRCPKCGISQGASLNFNIIRE